MTAGPASSTGPSLDELERRLAEAEGAVQALIAGQVDAVLDPATGDAVLLPQAHGALVESEAHYRWLATALAEAQAIAHVGSWEWDVAAGVVTWSDELYRIHGLSPGGSPLTYAAFLEHIHPDDLGQVRAQIDEALRAPRPFRFDHRILRPDGSLRYLRARGVVKADEHGQAVRVLGTCHDITDWVVAQSEIGALNAALEARVRVRTAQLEAANHLLRAEIAERYHARVAQEASEQQYRQLVELSPEPILVQSEGRLVFVNRAGAELLGAPAAALLGLAVLDLIHPDDRALVRKGLADLREGQAVPRTELRLVRRDGAMADVEVAASALPYGGAPAILILARDISDRKRAERENARLHEAERQARAEAQRLNAELEQRVRERTAQLQALNVRLERSRDHLRRLSTHLQSVREAEQMRIAREIHDGLGQPLTALKMDMAWVRRHLDAEQRIVRQKLGAMARLIDEVVQSVRRIATDLRPGILDDLGLLPALEWQLQDFQARTGLACRLETELEEIDLDAEVATAVFRIFQEALTNIARHAAAGQVEVSLAQDAGHLVLQVRDNGRGLSQDEVEKPKSFGLLGIRERVRLLGGELSLQGQPGQGTTVIARIPLQPEAPG